MTEPPGTTTGGLPPISKTNNSSCGTYNCFVWVVDSHPEDINQVDYVAADGTVNAVAAAGVRLHRGHLLRRGWLVESDGLETWNAPLSNDPVAISFKQTIADKDALRTGQYAKTLTFTLSTTNP